MSDFPDYEAAARTLTEYPFDEENDYVQDQARIKAYKAVNAALGDGLLYRECSECKGWGRLKQGDPEPCPVCGDNEQVWPKEISSE